MQFSTPQNKWPETGAFSTIKTKSMGHINTARLYPSCWFVRMATGGTHYKNILPVHQQLQSHTLHSRQAFIKFPHFTLNGDITFVHCVSSAFVTLPRTDMNTIFFANCEITKRSSKRTKETSNGRTRETKLFETPEPNCLKHNSSTGFCFWNFVTVTHRAHFFTGRHVKK